jgi:hypothetical protein
VLGGGDTLDIMQAARHTTTKNADKYRRDAKSIVHVQAAQDDGLENRVSKWKSNFLDNSMTVRGVMTGTNEIDLPTLAKNFVLQELKVSDQSKINHPCYLAKAIMSYRQPTHVREQLEMLCKTFVPSQYSQLKTLVFAFAKEIAASSNTPSKCLPNPLVTQTSTGATLQPGNGIVASPENDIGSCKNRKRGDGGENLDEQRSMLSDSKLSAKEKLTLLVEFHHNMPCNNLTESARVWKIRTIDKTFRCLENHFHGNVDALCTALNNKIILSKFPCSGQKDKSCQLEKPHSYI